MSRHARAAATFQITSSQAAHLSHTVWIGGSPCAGKTTMATRLRAGAHLLGLSADDTFQEHVRGFTPQGQPALCAWLQASCDERWLRSLDELLDHVIACYAEHCAIVVQEAIKRARRSPLPLLVEGSCLMPDCLAPLASQAGMVWVVPSPDFQRYHYARRDWARASLSTCTDPARAFDNWMARDIAFADWVRVRCRALGLECLVVNGRQAVDTIAARAAGLLGLTWKGRR